MTHTLYSTVNIASAVLIGGLGAVIASVRIPALAGNRHYRMARVFLCTAFVTLALLKLVEIVVPKDSDDELTGCVALIVAAYQAMCFTTALLLFIGPQRVTRRRVSTQLSLITATAAVLLASWHWLPPHLYRTVLVVCSVLYVTLLSCYTVQFVNAYRHFDHDMFDYYQEEDLNRQLRWIAHTFYSSLAVGCLVFLSLTGVRALDGAFIVIYSTFYVYLTGRFINYGSYVGIVARALSPAEPVTTVPARDSRARTHSDKALVKPVADTPLKYTPISARLRQWVDERRYLRSDVAVKDVAAELETTPRRLNEYFAEVVGEEFIKWRVRLRLQYACRLIDDDPDRPMREVAAESGFGDRSYFYRKFNEIVGIPVTRYKEEAKLRRAARWHDEEQ